MKKFIFILLLISLMLGLVMCSRNKTIGTISGIENECITIAEATYIKDNNNSFSSKNRGKFLGMVSNSNIQMRVYSVKSNDSEDYIYALWDFEGSFYIKQ